MLFLLKSKPPWLPTSAANRIKLNTYQVAVWFPQEARHRQTFGLSSRKSEGKVYKSFRNQALLLSSQSSLFTVSEYLIGSLLSTCLSILQVTKPAEHLVC